MTVTGLSGVDDRKEMRAQNFPGRLMNGKRRIPRFGRGEIYRRSVAVSAEHDEREMTRPAFLASDLEKFVGAPLRS